MTRAWGAGVGDLVRVQRGVAIGLALHTQETVRQLLVVRTKRVGTAARWCAPKQHVVVRRRRAQLGAGRVLELEENHRDLEDAGDRGPGGERCPRPRHRRVQRTEVLPGQEALSQGAHRARLPAPHAVLAEVEAGNLPAHPRHRRVGRGLLGTSRSGQAQDREHGDVDQRARRHGNPRRVCRNDRLRHRGRGGMPHTTARKYYPERHESDHAADDLRLVQPGAWFIGGRDEAEDDR